jgi:iron complex outermembrane recepter protein
MPDRFAKRFSAKLLGSIAVSVLTTAAQAQSDELSRTPLTPEEVVVTAQKREEKLSEVPLSVTAISGAELQRENDFHFEDFAARIPGLSFIGQRTGATQITLRGITSGAGQPNASVGTYMDETPLTSSTVFASGNILTPDFDTSDIQRIEVLRGPQGTLYGANTLGGILKYVTTPPDLTEFGGRVEADGSKVDHGDGGYGVRGTLNAPIIDGSTAVRINAFKRKDPGYVNDPTTARSNVGGSDIEGGRISLLSKPNDQLSVRLTIASQYMDGEGIASEDVISQGLTPYFGDLQQKRLAEEFVRLRNTVYNATVNWSLGWADFVSSSSYNETHAHTQTDYSFQVAALERLLPSLSSGAGQDNSITQEKFSQEWRLQSPSNETLEWRAGLFYTHELGNRHQTVNPVTAVPLTLYDVTFDSLFREYAAFGDLTYHFTSQFDVTAGARVSKNDQTFNEIGSGLLLGVAPGSTFPYVAESTDHSVTWLVGPRWRPNDNLMVYGRVASGYRPGGPNVVSPSSAGHVPLSFDPDRLINYELGAKGNSLGGSFVYDVDVFHINWNNVQLTCLLGGLSYECNGGKAQSRGVEANLTYVPVAGLTLNVNGAFTDATLTTDVPTMSAKAGDPLPYVPRWSGSANVDYQWPLFGSWSGVLGATDRYTGSSQSSYSLDLVRVPLPSFNLVDLRCGVTDSRWNVSIFAKNVGNRRGITDAIPEAALSATSILYAASIIQPRTVGLSIARDF